MEIRCLRPLLALFLVFTLLSFVPPWLPVIGADTDNDFDHATPLMDRVQGTGNVKKGEDDKDYYKFSVGSEGLVLDTYIGILGYDDLVPAKNDLDIHLYDPERIEVDWSTTRLRYEYISWLVRGPGTFYIVVECMNGTSDYTIEAYTKDPIEVKGGDVKDGYLSYDYYRASEWYKVNLNGGREAQTVAFELVHDPDADFNLYLMDLGHGRSFFYNMSWSGSLGASNREVVSATASYSGYYFLRARAWTGWGNFTLRVTTGNRTTDDDNVPARARLLEHNGTVVGHVDQADDHFDYYYFNSVDGERLSLDLTLLNGWRDIFSLMVLDTTQDIVMDKTNYIFEPQHDIGDEIDYWIDLPSTGAYYIVVSAKIALVKDQPDDLSDETAAADYRFLINMSKHEPASTNSPPISKGNVTTTMNEDTTLIMDMRTIFEDPDSDPLNFTASATTLKTSIDTDGMVHATPPEDWNGIDVIVVTASDPSGQQAVADITVTVRPMPEFPILDDAFPDPSKVYDLKEGENMTMEAWFTDKDSDSIMVRWFKGEAPLDGTEAVLSKVDETFYIYYRFATTFTSAGMHSFDLVTDDGDGTETVTWNVRVLNVNRPPTISTITPGDNSSFKEKDTIPFNVVCNDLDGDPLTVTWMDGKTILYSAGADKAGFDASLSPGTHTITASVSDGNSTVRRVIRISVKEEQRPFMDWKGFLIAGLVAAIVGLFIVYGYYFGLSKRKIDHLEDLEGELEEEEMEMRSIQGKGEKRERKSGKGATKMGTRTGGKSRRRRKLDRLDRMGKRRSDGDL